MTNSSPSGGAHGLLISTKGGYGFQASSASNHGVAGITAHASKAGVLATHNGPEGDGAALIANGRTNSGAIVRNSGSGKPALLAVSSNEVSSLGMRVIAEGPSGTGIIAEGRIGISAFSDGTAISAQCDSSVQVPVAGSFDAISTNDELDAVGLSIGAGIVPPGGQPRNGTAISATGNVVVNGNLTKSSGAFRIDHPLDPANKYLHHSFVESPDMKNVYDGSVVADGNGQATVTMPEWFDELNKDLRYQLTAVGGPAPDLHIKAKLANGTFTIGGAEPEQEICWQVTGTRKDAWANAHRIEVETDKPKRERGTYLFPKGFGQPETKRIGYKEPPKGER